MTETREIKLTKQVYETQPSKDSLDREFVEFLPTKYLINELFDLYNELFYEIKLRGKKSHNSIIIKSSKYVGIPLDPKIKEIANLKEQIQNLKEEIDSIEDEHPFIPNFNVIRNRNAAHLNY